MNGLERIAELKAEATVLFNKMSDVLRGGNHPLPKTLMDAVEVRFFIAARRLLLAQLELPDAPDQMFLTVKTQKEDLGVLLIVSFKDRLAAIDPTRWFDCVFVPPTSPAYRWMKYARSTSEPHREALLPCPAYEEFKWIRRTLYPDGIALPKGKRRRPFTRQEVYDTLAALEAYKSGETLPVEFQLRDLDLDNITPIAALETLERLQDQARRIADTKQFLPKSLGGGLSPSE